MFSYTWDAVLQSHRKFGERLNKVLNVHPKGDKVCRKEGPFFAKPLSFLPWLGNIQMPALQCGAGPNSNFQDVFKLCDENDRVVPMTSEDVIDEKMRQFFKHQWETSDPELVEKWKAALKDCKGVVDSSCWAKKFYDLDTDMNNNGQMNIDYLIWQNKAAFPTFRKPYRRLHRRTGTVYEKGLPKGVYKLRVHVLTTLLSRKDGSFDYVQKAFVITASSWLGIRNIYFAWAYIVVGSF